MQRRSLLNHVPRLSNCVMTAIAVAAARGHGRHAAREGVLQCQHPLELLATVATSQPSRLHAEPCCFRFALLALFRVHARAEQRLESCYCSY
jgi:hypothetical protein